MTRLRRINCEAAAKSVQHKLEPRNVDPDQELRINLSKRPTDFATSEQQIATAEDMVHELQSMIARQKSSLKKCRRRKKVAKREKNEKVTFLIGGDPPTR
jgi:septal ring factor EnvC (AmiA/AmiB activator)